jgi:hypothetical protein
MVRQCHCCSRISWVHDKRGVEFRVTCGESKCGYSGVCDVWYDDCILLGSQSVNGDSTHHFRGGERGPDQEAALKALCIHWVVKCQRRKRRNKVRNYKKKARS